MVLTSLLHIKVDSRTLTIKDLEASFKATLLDQSNLSLKNSAGSALQLIYDEADALAAGAGADDDVELESKVILSIGIRLKVEDL